MAKTRSGGLQKDGDSSSSRSRQGGLTAKGKYMKISTSSGSSSNGSSGSRLSTRNAKNAKSLIASISEATGSSNLRRSNRETPKKKAKQNISPSPDKSKSNKAAKKGLHNPPRKSDRIEAHSLSSSSASKGSKKTPNPSIPAKNEKEKSVNQKKDKDFKMDTVNGMPKKRKRLDARSYRAILQRGERPKLSGPAKMHGDDAPLRPVIDTSASDSTEMLPKGNTNCLLKEDKATSTMVEAAEGALDGSTSGIVEAAKLVLGTDHGSHLANPSIGELGIATHSSKNGVGIPSPVGVTSKANNDECRGISKSSTNERSFPDIDFEASAILVDKQLQTQESSRATVTSSPGTARKKPKQCAKCSEDQSIRDMQMAVCSCASKTECDFFPFNSEIDKEKYAKFLIIDEVEGNNVPNQNCLLESSRTMHYPVSNDEKTQGVEVGDHAGDTEEHSTVPKLDEPSVDEPDGVFNACVVCKNPGMLLCCDGKGCKRSYHLSCLDVPMQDIPPGVWLCTFCVKKRIQYGIYSVIEGVESLWDMEGMQSGKHYFVKYKSLAHVHNRWVPESELLSEAPELVSKFNKRNKKDKTIKWRQEWTEPVRLLKKRLLLPPKQADEFFHALGDAFTYCNVEWLVKWRDLGYEHATWELESSPFLCTPEAMLLMKDYEGRCGKARKASDPSKTNKAKQNSFHKLLRLPDGCPLGLDNDHLSSVNQLCEYWHKSQNAVFIDDQERVTKTVFFIMSLLPDVCRPFLIISPPASLSLWEEKFIRLAPSINVVSYSGSRDICRLICALEFYEEGGCVMFEVLLSHPDAIIEDLETIRCIGWEAIIVDECQSSRVSKNLEQLKNLSTDFRLLLLSSPLKDNLAEYINLLSFLDSEGAETASRGTNIDTNECLGTLAFLKTRLARYIAYERKLESSMFSEYWIPSCLSDVQLELYCSTLISNSFALRSSSKIDHVGALRDILISLQKCCDHPYLVDQSLQTALTKDHPVAEILDIGVVASGKLLLLDKILQEMRNHKLRVLILFQSAVGAGRNPIGDILDDFLHQRFGADSYERVERGLQMSKKQTAMKMFNDTAKGRFVFLIENRACLPSVKLSSIDAIIIYNSDWNPLNDLRALQKISIESQPEQIIIFRLYTFSTVEEKVLMFAKQDVNLDSKMESISPNVSHSLLSWGASHLLHRLDDIHQQNDPSMWFQFPTLDEVVQDLVAKLLNMAGGCERSSSIIAKAQLSGTSYSRKITLAGEKEGISSFDGDSPTFWTTLLDGRYPQWLYISDPLQKSRRKVQNLEKSTNLHAASAEDDESKKKLRKLTHRMTDPISPRGQLQGKGVVVSESEDTVLSKKHGSSGSGQQSIGRAVRDQSDDACRDSSFHAMIGEMHDSIVSPPSGRTVGHKIYTVESEGNTKSRNAQRNLSLLLMPELLQLCQTLQLPENVKATAEVFLEYTLENYQVSQEPKDVLQAFNMALCWRAASLFKYKMDHKESLAIAGKYLNYQCNEELVESVYEKLRALKRKFSHLAGALTNQAPPTNQGPPNSVKNPQQESLRKELISGTDSDRATCNHDKSKDGVLQETPSGHLYVEQLLLEEQEQVPVLETPAEINQHIGSLKDELQKKRIDLVRKVYSSREEKILLRQQQEIMEFEQYKEKEKTALHRTYHLDLERAHIGLVDPAFTKTLHAFEEHMRRQRQKLEALQLGARVKERELKGAWLQRAKSGQLDESFDIIPLPDTEFVVEEFKWDDDLAETSSISGNSDMVCAPSFFEQSSDLVEIISVDCTDRSRMSDNPIVAFLGVRDLSAEPLLSEANTTEQVESDEPMVDAVATISSEVTSTIPIEAEAPASQTITVEKEPSDSEYRPTKPVEGENIPGCSSSQQISTSVLDAANVAQQIGPSNVDVIAAGPHLDLPLSHSDGKHGPAEPVGENIPCSSSQQIVISTPDVVDATQQAGPSNVDMNAASPYLDPALSLSGSEHRPAEPVEGENIPGCSFSQQIGISAPDVVNVAQLLGPSNVDVSAAGSQLDATLSRAATQPCNTVISSTERILAPAVTTSLSGHSNQPVSQFIMPPLTSTSNIPPERIHPDVLRSIAAQSDMTNSLFQPFLMPLSRLSQPLHDEPLKNELMKLHLHEDIITKKHDDKVFQLKLECEQEIVKIKMKYDALLRDEDSSFLREKKIIGEVCQKILMNQTLAEEFRAKMVGNREASVPPHGSNQGPSTQQSSQASRVFVPQWSSVASTAALVPVLNPATRPSTSAFGASPPVRATPPHAVRQASPIPPNNPSISQFSPMRPPTAGAQAGGSEHRAPAPHLQRFRQAASFVHNTRAVPNQQQLLASIGPATTPGGPVAANNAQPYVGSMQPSSSNTLPVHWGTSTPLDTPGSSTQAGADINSMLRLSAESSVLLETLIAASRITPRGSSSQTTAGATAGAADVVCLSDDDD